MPLAADEKRSEPDIGDRGGVGTLSRAYTGSYSRSSAEGLRSMSRSIQAGTAFARLALESLNTRARRIWMPTFEEHALLTEIDDRLIELYVRQDEAKRTEDRDLARQLQIEIDQARGQREEIRR
jgi:hypothetical protein